MSCRTDLWKDFVPRASYEQMVAEEMLSSIFSRIEIAGSGCQQLALFLLFFAGHRSFSSQDWLTEDDISCL